MLGQVFLPQAPPAAGSLMISTLGLCGISSTWRQPDHTASRGQPSRKPIVRHQALPAGCRVVALGEVEERPHPAQPGLAAALFVAGHLRDLPARQGSVVVTGVLASV